MFKYASTILALSLLGGCGISTDASDNGTDHQGLGQSFNPPPIPPPPGPNPEPDADDDDDSDNPVLKLTPRSVFFGTLCVEEDGVKPLVITNSGGEDLEITSLRLTGDGLSIASRPSLPATIAPGRSVTVQLVLTPFEYRRTTYAGNLRIASNDPTNPITNVRLSGLALPPVLTVRPAQVDFGDVGRNRTSTRNLSLINNGRCEIEVSYYELSGALSNLTWADDLPSSNLTTGDRFDTAVHLNCKRSGDVDTTIRFFDSAGNNVGSNSLTGYCE